MTIRSSFLLAFLLLLSQQGALAQSEAALLGESQQTISVDAVIPDQEIKNRLVEVVNAAELSQTIEIEVKNGVVIISGAITQAKDVVVIESLAKRTEGVVAVIDRTTLKSDVLSLGKNIENSVQRLVEQAYAWLPRALVAAALFAITLGGVQLVALLVHGLYQKPTDSQAIIVRLVRNLLQALCLVLGLYFILQVSGLSGLAVSLIGGTGVLGIILGFAFRDIGENFLASILLSTHRPFRIGDVIAVAGHTGVVDRLTTRCTVLMNFEGDHVQIPNSTVFKSDIVNLTANPNKRFTVNVGIGYDASIKKARSIILQAMLSHQYILDSPEPKALVDQLGSSTVNFTVYYWINITKHDGLTVRSSLLGHIKISLERAGISMPDESREIIFPQGVPVHQIDGTASSSKSDAIPIVDTEDDMNEAMDFESETETIKDQLKNAVPVEAADSIL